MTVLAVMIKAADDVVMYLEGAHWRHTQHSLSGSNEKTHARRPFVHFTCVSVIFIIGLNVAGPCQSFKTLKEGHTS